MMNNVSLRAEKRILAWETIFPLDRIVSFDREFYIFVQMPDNRLNDEMTHGCTMHNAKCKMQSVRN